MIPALRNSVPCNRFLRDVRVHAPDGDDPAGDDFADEPSEACLAEALTQCRSSRFPKLVVAPDNGGAVMCIPVFRDTELRSIVSLNAAPATRGMGVFEIWVPFGPYQDLRLEAGYFGPLERFQNVSSYVRFEKGGGLPGTAWESVAAVIHDDLKNHPQFLRAAGAAVDSLQTAIGIPIFSTQFVATVVLMGSQSAPLARAVEVWKPVGDQFELAHQVYDDVPEPFRLALGTRQPAAQGLWGRIGQAESAVVLEDLEEWEGQRSLDRNASTATKVVGIPTYAAGELTCVTVLVL